MNARTYAKIVAAAIALFVAVFLGVFSGTLAAKAATGPVPDGPAASLDGRIVFDETGAQLLTNWGRNPVNAWCGGGTSTASGTDLVLTGTSAGGCADLGSDHGFKAGIYQATFYTADTSGHPAFWMAGFSNVQGAGAWTRYGEIDAAEDLSGCWSVVYHAHGPVNTNGPDCETQTAGWHTVTIVRRYSGYTSVYYDGRLRESFSTDMSGVFPSPLYLMFDTSNTGTQFRIADLMIWDVRP